MSEIIANLSLKDKMDQISVLRTILKKPSQELIVALVTLVLFLVFSVIIEDFFSRGNLIALVQRVAVVGILGVGMAIVVIGRGIDLSQITTMAICSAWTIWLVAHGISVIVALLLALAFALIIGIVNGYLIAFVEIPSLFTTLATGIFFFGIGHLFLLKSEVILHLPESFQIFIIIGRGTILGIPIPIWIFALVAFSTHQFLLRTSIGHFIYAHGDNSDAARLTGIGVRPLTMLEYTICAVIACIAGLVRASTVAGVDIRIISSSLIFDVILVVVIGGISLIGGRGSIWSVLAGTIFTGTLLNGMTMLNMQNDVQDIVKAAALLGAIMVDNRIHPRDEETERQGDI